MLQSNAASARTPPGPKLDPAVAMAVEQVTGTLDRLAMSAKPLTQDAARQMADVLLACPPSIRETVAERVAQARGGEELLLMAITQRPSLILWADAVARKETAARMLSDERLDQAAALMTALNGATAA